MLFWLYIKGGNICFFFNLGNSKTMSCVFFFLGVQIEMTDFRRRNLWLVHVRNVKYCNYFEFQFFVCNKCDTYPCVSLNLEKQNLTIEKSKLTIHKSNLLVSSLYLSNLYKKNRKLQTKWAYKSNNIGRRKDDDFF